MFKIFYLILTTLLIFGCGDSSSEGSGWKNYTIDNNTLQNKFQFVTVQKSHFVNSKDKYSGHFETIVRTENNPYDTNQNLLNSKNYLLLENNKIKDEGKISVNSSTNDIESITLILLDFSGSIMKDGCSEDANNPCYQIKSAVRDFVINSNSKIAIYYFDAKKEIIPLSSKTAYPTEKKNDILEAISQINNVFIDNNLKGYDYSTNLYGSVINSTEKICSWINCDNENIFSLGTLIVFTDGKDLAEYYTKTQMLNLLRKDKILYCTMGIGNADNETLLEISTNNCHQEGSIDEIKKVFDAIYNKIQKNSDFYKISYCPSTRSGFVDIQILYDDKENGVSAKTQEESIAIDDKDDISCDL